MMTLAQAAKWCGGELRGAENSGATTMTGATIDTRELNPGDLFVALPGANVDGRDFIPDAARKGAVAALCAPTGSDSDSVSDSEISIPRILVADPVMALGSLARRWRGQVSRPRVVAITGTNGKTTTRELAARVLRKSFGDDAVLSPLRNFNNRLGVPLTLLRLRDSHSVAVLELAMNRAGEIAALTRMAKPDVGVITNAGRGHLEGLGTVENVARAKGELIEKLPPAGVVVLNADDPHFSLWKKLAGSRRVYSFGFARPPDPDCRDVVITAPNGKKFCGDFPPDMPRHMAANIMAACAGLAELGISDEAAESALAEFGGIPGRLEAKRARGGANLIDDSYNANPDSVLTALEVLRRADGVKIAALGDMLELGPESGKLHEEVGARAGERGVVVFGFGPDSKKIVEAARRAGGEARHFSGKAELIAALRAADRPGATILVKGSRGMKMDEAARALQAEEGG